MFQLEVTQGITFVEGDRHGRFPFGDALLLAGRDLRLLVDTGVGPEVLGAVTDREAGPATSSATGSAGRPIDAVLNTHYHIDHVSGNGPVQDRVPGVAFWCPAGEADALSSWGGFLRLTGFDLPGLEDADTLRRRLGWRAVTISREVADGETIELGGLRATALRLPGHTPGHTGLWFPSERVIFIGDIDLSSFGPWYGDVYSDIDAYLASMDRVAALVEEASSGGRHPVTVLTSHRRPATRETFQDRLPAFRAKIARRDERILAILGEAGPLTLGELTALWPVYGPQSTVLPGIYKSELFMCKHHLDRLARAGKVAASEPDVGGDRVGRRPAGGHRPGAGPAGGDLATIGGNQLWRVL